MNKIIIVFMLLLLQSCASTSEDGVRIVDKVGTNCIPRASVSSFGFNVLPPVASMLARKGLKMKAKEYGLNTVVIEEQKGTFTVEMKGVGYQCI